MIPPNQASPKGLSGQKNLRLSKEAQKKQRGQLVFEYILLMMVAVAVSVMIKNIFIGGEAGQPDSAGIMTKFVYRLTAPIASDTPSD